MKKSTNQIWNIGAETEGRSDYDFFETDDNKFGIYFSKIDEYGMLKFISPVQIWMNKNDPKLLFENAKIEFEYQQSESCYYLDKSEIIVLLIPCNRRKYFDLLYVLLDFSRRQFATLNTPDFILTETQKGSIRLDVHIRYVYSKEKEKSIMENNGKIVQLNNLRWHELKALNQICALASVDG